MKRDFSQELVGLHNAKLAELIDGEHRPMTLCSVSVNALMGQYQDEQSLGGDEKFRRFQLAVRITEGDQDVSAEEISLLKRLIGKAYTPMVVGPAYVALERDPEAAPAA